MAGRGIDFEHKFKTSRWAEDLLLKSLRKEPGFVAIRFGLSEVKADRDVKYDKLGLKEPDLLVYETAALTERELELLDSSDCSAENPEKFKPGNKLNFVIAKACAAIEVEFSPYKASEMKGRGWKPKTPEQWARRPLKHAKPPSAPNIWVKGEDLDRLNKWKTEFGVPIVVAHIFDQEGFAVRLEAVNAFFKKLNKVGCDKRELQVTTGIFYQSDYSYDRVDAQGAGETKPVFNVSPAAATKIGDVKNVKVEAQLGLSASKKYVTHSIFSGGHITFSPEFLSMLKTMRS